MSPCDKTHSHTRTHDTFISLPHSHKQKAILGTVMTPLYGDCDEHKRNRRQLLYTTLPKVCMNGECECEQKELKDMGEDAWSRNIIKPPKRVWCHRRTFFHMHRRHEDWRLTHADTHTSFFTFGIICKSEIQIGRCGGAYVQVVVCGTVNELRVFRIDIDVKPQNVLAHHLDQS